LYKVITMMMAIEAVILELGKSRLNSINVEANLLECINIQLSIDVLNTVLWWLDIIFNNFNLFL